MSKPLDTQVGGNHYKDLAIQPVEYIFKNDIGYFEGCVIKYVTRWKNKGGVQDLEKAKHFLELLIELQEQKAKEGLLSLVKEEQEKESCPEIDSTVYRYLILADGPAPKDYHVGEFAKSDAEDLHSKSVKFYSREEAEKFIRFNQNYLSKPPYSLAFYLNGEGEKQFYLTRRGLSDA